MSSDGRGTRLNKNKGPKKPLSQRTRCQACNDTSLVLATSRTGPKRKGWEFARVPCSKCAAGKLEADRRAALEQKAVDSPKGKAFRKNWSAKCMNCDQKPTVGDTDLCGPCCFGEAETANGNW
jgi:hypothetical protein